jgi:hypothetical protein
VASGKSHGPTIFVREHFLREGGGIEVSNRTYEGYPKFAGYYRLLGGVRLQLTSTEASDSIPVARRCGHVSLKGQGSLELGRP